MVWSRGARDYRAEVRLIGAGIVRLRSLDVVLASALLLAGGSPAFAQKEPVCAAPSSLTRADFSLPRLAKSLAAKSASRYLGAYPASKFPLAAYAQQMRLEQGPLGLHTLLVCPGPIRRDDAGSRYDSKAGDLPAAARQPGGGVKLKGIDPDWLARRILMACENRQAELVVPGRAKLLFAISQLWPALGDWIVTRMTKQ